jgi:hypothetical protein
MPAKSFLEMEKEEVNYATEGKHVAIMKTATIEKNENNKTNLIIRFVTREGLLHEFYHLLKETTDWKFREFLRGMSLPDEVKGELIYDKTCLYNYHSHILEWIHKYLVKKVYNITLVKENYTNSMGEEKTTIKLDTKCVHRNTDVNVVNELTMVDRTSDVPMQSKPANW